MAESSTDKMLDRFGRFHVLSPEQQIETCRLVRRWLDWEGGPDAAPRSVQRAGQRAKQRMVETNMRLVVHIARRYLNRGLPLEDLVQEGAMGLIRAIELFDPSRGYQFSTFSYWWVRQAMTRALGSQVDTIRIPTNLQDQIRHVHAFLNEEQHEGRKPSDEEICSKLDLQPEQLERVRLAVLRRNTRSLNVKLTDDGGELGSIIPSEHDLAEEVFDQVDADRSISLINQLWPLLTPREQQIITRRYVESHSYRDIGRDLELPAQKVRLLEITACNKLRLWMEKVRQGKDPIAGLRPDMLKPWREPATARAIQSELVSMERSERIKRRRYRQRKRKARDGPELVTDTDQLELTWV